MKELEYPFDAAAIISKKKSIRRQLLERDIKYVEKRIAILGGSTTSDIKLVLELFLLDYGIKPIFFESEYNKYWEDAMFDDSELQTFNPEIIYICTSWRNVINTPDLIDTDLQVADKINAEYARFEQMWQKLFERFHCSIIQNNFDFPTTRLLGNKDATNVRGMVNFLTKLNLKFAEYAEQNENFFILDLNYISALYGLDKWYDPFAFYMYKYAVAINAIPYLSFEIAKIIKALLGKNKKGFVLDLDNTLWGGIVGDDGAENLEIGQETALGQTYYDFQKYLHELTKLGIILNVNSKNEKDNAIAGLNHPEGILKPDDFIVIKANWEPKSQNFTQIANELSLGADSLVFVDDNPAERAIINHDLPEVATPEMTEPHNYMRIIDHSGFFETINISQEDLKKTEMYKENAKRNELQASFTNYDDFLKSLKMSAKIEPFIPMYMSRIAQLTNKSNQFNLTTKRYTQAEIEAVSSDPLYVALYGKLEDKFGDNGVVSVVIGRQEKEKIHIDLWIMSCRVLKRNMEHAMMDKLVEYCQKLGITEIYGYYYPTAKNAMVKDFYGTIKFDKVSEDDAGNSVWKYATPENYQPQNQFINVKE